MPRSLLLLAVAALLAQPCLAAVTFDWAYVGNADNAADPQTGLGAISYIYAIAKHEVTNAQYVEFLNAIDATGANTRTLYNPDMAGNFGGIDNTGTSDGARYILKAGRAQNPVTYVSFFDAMRFTNWLHNDQGSGDTETGAYVIGDGLNEVRSTSAKYWIPSENEWYKAAYHDAAVGTAGTYFDYANGSNSEPISDRPGDNPAAMNFVNNDGRVNGFNDGYAVSGIGNFPSDTNPYTESVPILRRRAHTARSTRTATCRSGLKRSLFQHSAVTRVVGGTPARSACVPTAVASPRPRVRPPTLVFAWQPSPSPPP